MRPEDAADPYSAPQGAPPAALADLLARLAERPSWRGRLEGGRVHEVWPELAGEQVAAHAEPVRLRGGVLVLRAASPAWATQLRYLAPALIARADEVLGPGMVTQVTVTAGSGTEDRRGRRR